jgi:membrane dipeptidase
MSSIPVFDGHNDVLLRPWLKQAGDPVADFIEGDGKGHMDLPRMVNGGLAGGMFAVFVPNLPDNAPVGDDEVNPPESKAVAQSPAFGATLAMASLLGRLDAVSK